MAALTLATLQDRILCTRITGAVAVALWFCASAAYVWAIAIPTPASSQLSEVQNGDSLIREVLRRAEQESKQVDKRQRYANFIAAFAVAATIATVGLALLAGLQTQLAIGIMSVKPAQQKMVSSVCPAISSPRIYGLIDTSTITQPAVAITLSAKQCGGSNKITLIVPRYSIELLVTK